MKKIWQWLKTNNTRPTSVLFPPILTVMLAELILTLQGQPMAYWSDFDKMTESNFIGIWLLKIHPLVFVYAFLFYIIIAYFFITYAKPKLRWTAWLTLLIAHSSAAVYWLDRLIPDFIKNIPKENISGDMQILTIEIIIFSLFSYFIASKALEKFANGSSKQNGQKT